MNVYAQIVADPAQYSRGVVRPRFFWDGGDGKTALLTGVMTYEDRNRGTVSVDDLPKTMPVVQRRCRKSGAHDVPARENDLSIAAEVIAPRIQSLVIRRPVTGRSRFAAPRTARPGWPAWRPRGTLSSRATFRASPTVMSCPASSFRMIEIARCLSVSANARADFRRNTAPS